MQLRIVSLMIYPKSLVLLLNRLLFWCVLVLCLWRTSILLLGCWLTSITPWEFFPAQLQDVISHTFKSWCINKPFRWNSVNSLQTPVALKILFDIGVVDHSDTWLDESI